MQQTFRPPPARGLTTLRRGAVAAAAIALAGCASFSDDGGHAEVARLTRERTGHAPADQRRPAQADAAQARIAELLRQPLTADAAVEIALLGNRGLQARLAGLGIAEADLVQAGRLHNPTFSLGRLGGSGVEIDRTLLFDVLGLLAMPRARQIEQARFEQAQLQAAADAVALAAGARRAYFDAVAAQQMAGYAAQVQEAAEASAELARRMAAAGNFSALDQMREQAFQADASVQLARARHQAVAARERLLRLLGLGADAQALALPGRLPALPPSALPPQHAEQTAVDRRLDVLIARRAAEASAQSLGLTRATRFVNVLEAGPQNQSNSGEPRRNGFEVTLELPLFDFGGARVARAEADYMQAVQHTAQVADDARSEVREAYSAYATAYRLARLYQDEVVPLRKRISDETLLRYNGMLGSVFDLLADAREQILGVTAAVAAQRDFWIAESDLQAAMGGVSPAAIATPGSDAAAPAAPAAAGH